MNFFITSGPGVCPGVFVYLVLGLKCILMQNYSLSQTGSTLARTNLSPFARCTLGLNRHSPAISIKIFYAITACMT